MELRQSRDDPDWWFLVTYGIACQGAGELDKAAVLFHKALAKNRKRDDSGGISTAYTLGWLARNLLLQGRYAEAEPKAREAMELYAKELRDDPVGYYFVSILGAVLCGQKKYAQGESILLQGYEGMKSRENLLDAVWKHRMAETGERVVHFYEETDRPEKAREWRQRLLKDRSKK